MEPCVSPRLVKRQIRKNRLLHLRPDGPKVIPDLLAFRQFHVFGKVQTAEAAEFLDRNDPMINKILSYPMSIEETEDSLRDDIAEWKRDQDELETEIFSYNSRHIKTLDNAPHD